MKEDIKDKPLQIIKRKIFNIRGVRVMLDSDLADLYQVTTKNINKAVNRNIERFPRDFYFQLTKEELINLRFQIGTSSLDYGGRRYLPYVFTEHGVAMLSAVLRSDRAVHMSLFIIRAFVKMREMLENHHDLAEKIEEIEQKQIDQGDKIAEVYEVVKYLIKVLPDETEVSDRDNE